MPSFRSGLVFFLSGLFFAGIFAEVINAQTDTAGAPPSRIKWIDALDVRVIMEEDRRIHYLTGNVELRQDSMFFFADSAVLTQNLLFAAGNVVVIQGDSLTIFGDTLNYNGDLRYGYLTGESFIQQGNSLLYSNFLEYDSHNKMAYYNRGAVLTDGDFQLTSIRGIYNLNTERITFKDSVEIVGEDFLLRTSEMDYDSETSTAFFTAPTVIVQQDSRIYTEGGHYNLETGDAVFFNNPQYKKEGEISRADTMIYSASEETLLLIDRVYYQKDSTIITSDRLFYDSPSQIAIITGNARVVDGSRVIESDEIIYDLEQGKFNTVGRSTVRDEKQELTADNLFYGENEGEGEASGNVVWKDLESGMELYSMQAVFSDSTGSVKAYGGRPLLIYPSETDSLFLVADTIFSFELISPSDTQRITKAYYNVLIYRNDFQAVCDSLTHQTIDSTFRMMYDPIIWMDTTQLTGDTIDAILKDGSISSAFIRQNAMILTSPDSIYFNQMKGREITAGFDDGSLREVRVYGNAEALYFVLDQEDAYIGVNKSECAEIRITLLDNAVERIRFFGKPTNNLTPMHKATEGNFRLEGFNWRAELRPRSLEDILKGTLREGKGEFFGKKDREMQKGGEEVRSVAEIKE